MFWLRLCTITAEASRAISTGTRIRSVADAPLAVRVSREYSPGTVTIVIAAGFGTTAAGVPDPNHLPRRLHDHPRLDDGCCHRH